MLLSNKLCTSKNFNITYNLFTFAYQLFSLQALTSMVINIVNVNIAMVCFIFEVRFSIHVGYINGFLQNALIMNHVLISIESCWFKFYQDIIWKSVKPYDDQFIIICFGLISLCLGLVLSAYRSMTAGMKSFCHGIVEQHVWYESWHSFYTDEFR